MTTSKSLKQRIRARMAATGERYTTARMHVLGVRDNAELVPNRVPGYDLVGGGSHPDTACLHNALLAAGIVAPHDGEPYSDALLYGLGGGTGFLYAVFQYQGMDPILSVGVRHTMMGHDFARAALERSGVALEVSRTASEAKAEAMLDAAIGEGFAPILTVDDPALPYSGLPQHHRGLSAQQVTAVGADDDSVWLDDRTLVRIAREDLRMARASYKKPRHHTMVVRAGGTVESLRRGVTEAIAANVRNLEESPFKGFASNWGFAGMEKWARLMVDGRNPKRWAAVFSEDRTLFLALTRVRAGIEREYTPVGAGRGVYAEFLDEAAVILEEDELTEVAGSYRALERDWSGLARAATADLPEFERWEELAERFDTLLLERSGDAGSARRQTFDEMQELAGAVSLPHGFAHVRLSELSARVASIGVAEQEAADRLRNVLDRL